MAIIRNATTALGASDADGASAIEIRSEGQQLLDRQLAARNRLRKMVDRLGEVKASITAPTFEHAGDTSTSSSASSFFEGLSLMTDEFERVASELETCIEDLARLF